MRFGTYLGRRNACRRTQVKILNKKQQCVSSVNAWHFRKENWEPTVKSIHIILLLAWPQENVLYLSTNNAECGGKRLFQSSDFRPFSSAILETKKTLGTRLEIDLFSLYVLFSQQRSQGNLTLCLFINSAYMHMHVNKTKFERNSSLEYYHMTCIGKTKHTS